MGPVEFSWNMTEEQVPSYAQKEWAALLFCIYFVDLRRYQRFFKVYGCVGKPGISYGISSIFRHHGNSMVELEFGQEKCNLEIDEAASRGTNAWKPTRNGA